MKKLLTPFRYPGAKTRLADKIGEHLLLLLDGDSVYVEPFVGGGSVMLFICNNIIPRKIILNDLDYGVYSFWKCLSEEKLCAELIDKIEKTEPTVEEHSRQRRLLGSSSVVDAGYAALFLNRTSFSGIITSGPIGGYEQKSRYKVGCRYNSHVIAERVKNIHEKLSDRIAVFNCDFDDLIPRFDNVDAVIYCDPPYFVKGNQLYRCKMGLGDHERLSCALKALVHASFILSYDDVDEIRNSYSGWSKVVEIAARYSIKGQDRESWRETHELLIKNK